MKSGSGGERRLPRKHLPPPGWKDPLAPQQPLASARWILGAAAATLLFAAVCVYGTMCLLFWQGQWQLVFQPSPTITATPASAGLKYDEIRFDATETGILQLSGWWIPADLNAPYAADTLLFLHDGSGSLSATLPQLQVLHNLGMNLFAFDYRGFGNSVKIHPSEKSTSEDADAAWRYLTGTRHLAPSTIVIDGVRLGAAIAAETARRHPLIPALILEDLQPPVIDSLQLDSRMRLLPTRLLFHDRFDPAETLAHLQTPKLLVYPAAGAATLYYEQAAEPKQKAILGGGTGSPLYGNQSYLASLRSFLAKYLPAG
jgi:pimeloyl-ACP methyl ester carboxylesterase